MNDKEFIADKKNCLDNNLYYAMGKLQGHIEAFNVCKRHINEVCDVNITACSEALDKAIRCFV